MALSIRKASLLAGITLVICLLPEVRCQIMPTGCTYDSGVYECDFDILDGSGDIPLLAVSFDPIPQRLRLTNLPSNLTFSVFADDFSNISTAAYDENYPATLELKCTHSTNSSTTLTLATGFLAYMGHIEDFKIINCDIGAIPANAFSDLGAIDRFAIENGTITSMDAGMLNGVYIHKNVSAYPKYHTHSGEFSIRHTKVSGNIPADLLSGQTEMQSVVLDGMELTTLSASQFSGNPNLRFLSLSWNGLTDLPSGLFDGLDGLGEIRLYGTTLECTCESLWFMTHVDENYISLHGDIVCNNGEYVDKLAKRYYYENCATSSAESDCSGLLLMNTCMTIIDIVANILGILALIVGCIVLGLAIHMKKQLSPNSPGTSGPGSRRKPPPYSRKQGPTNVKKGWA